MAQNSIIKGRSEEDNYSQYHDLVINTDGSLNVTGSFYTSIGANELSQYMTTNLEETGTITYIGKQKNNGDWLLMKLDETTNLMITYANISNNVSYANYIDAWNNKASLIYNMLEDITL